jgi:hypothetical protein
VTVLGPGVLWGVFSRFTMAGALRISVFSVKAAEDFRLRAAECWVGASRRWWSVTIQGRKAASHD